MPLISKPIEYLKSIVTIYTGSLLIISSIGLFKFRSNLREQEKFPKEMAIAKYGAIGYMVLGIAIIAIVLFFNPLK